MDEKTKNCFNLTSIGLLLSLNKRKLIIFIALSFVVAVLLCFIIKPMYKSTVIMFPTSSGSISQSLITVSQQNKEILKFGEQEDVEQLMQMLLSSDIRNSIINKYDLYAHYRINKEKKYAISKLQDIYNSNITVSRTQYMSVKVEVRDEDPIMAAQIANDITLLVDSVLADIRYDRAFKAYNIVENELNNQKQKIQRISESLTALSSLGLIEIKSQTEMYSEQHAIAIATNNIRAKEEIEKKLDIIAKYGNSHSILKEQMIEEVKQLTTIEAKYREAKIDLEQNLPSVFVVNKAEIADKPYYPIYWLIIVTTMLSGFIFSVLTLIILDKFKNCNIKLKK